MKLFFLFITGPFFCTTIYGQDCKNFYYLQKNKTVEISIYNRNGEVAGKNQVQVIEINSNGNADISVVRTEYFDRTGKSIHKTVNNFKCINGILLMSMKIFLPADKQDEQNTTADNIDAVYLEYPADIKIGDKLKDGILSMEFDNNGGLKSSIEINITERIATAKESVTTAAGTWDCFKITAKNKLISKTAGKGIPINSIITEWFAPGFGVVKTETSSGKTEITSIK